jgi:hypothetical protein
MITPPEAETQQSFTIAQCFYCRDADVQAGLVPVVRKKAVCAPLNYD